MLRRPSSAFCSSKFHSTQVCESPWRQILPPRTSEPSQPQYCFLLVNGRRSSKPRRRGESRALVLRSLWLHRLYLLRRRPCKQSPH
ncbi:hypothetical protein PZA11_001116 [Diplocarpon coronariae]